MASKTVEYRIVSVSGVRGPETGLLYADTHMRRGIIVGNSCRVQIPTGIAIKTPPGAVVRIKGTYQHRAMGLFVTDREFFHIDEFEQITLDVWNAANATIAIQQGEAIAQIQAIPLTQPVRWGEADLIGITEEKQEQSNGQ